MSDPTTPGTTPAPGAAPARAGRGSPARELSTVLGALRRDPSMRLSENGRAALRLFDASTALLQHRDDLVAGVPPHCRDVLREAARGYASAWHAFADELQRSERRPEERV